MATKNLKINFDLMKEADVASVKGMLGFLSASPVEVQYKTLRPMLLAAYGENVKNILSLEGEGGSGGIGAKIAALLGLEEVQAKFASIMEEIRKVDAEIEGVAELKVGLFDDKLNGKWITDDDGKITARRLDIPVEMLGATPELIAKSENLLSERWNRFLAVMRENKVVAADKTPRGGKLTVENGKLAWKVPTKKPAQPRDPNAPKRESSGKGIYALTYGEGEGAVIVATGLGSKPKIVNAAAKFVHNRTDLFPDGKVLTKRDETIGAVNFGRAYSDKLSKLGFRWTVTEATPAPAPEAKTE